MSHAAWTRIREKPRPKYEVTHRLTAYSAQEEVPGNGRVLEKGTVVWIDPDFGWNNAAVSALIVRFFCGDVWFYIDRETFERSTRHR
jgi:hypothetical protein